MQFNTLINKGYMKYREQVWSRQEFLLELPINGVLEMSVVH